ncbi:serine protease [Nowakowskiella sp. JEL0407]|nr:serine protease [Nowakowskiella sp. JEL0407]
MRTTLFSLLCLLILISSSYASINPYIAVLHQSAQLHVSSDLPGFLDELGLYYERFQIGSPQNHVSISQIGSSFSPTHFIAYAFETDSGTAREIESHPSVAWVEIDQVVRVAMPREIQAASEVVVQNNTNATTPVGPNITTIGNWTIGSQQNSSWALSRLSARNATATNGTFSYPISQGPLQGSGNSSNATGAGSGVTVYILDTGLSLPNCSGSGNVTASNTTTGKLCAENEFGQRAVIGPSFVGGNGSATDQHGHGTFVASLVGSTTYGAAKNANITSVKVMNDQGEGRLSSILKGLEWVYTEHTNTTNSTSASPKSIVNLSIATSLSKALNYAVSALSRYGAIVVTSAGNEGDSACEYSPSSSVRAVTVGAIDEFDNIANFSNIGPCVDLFAPGVNVTGLWVGGGNQSSGNVSVANNTGGVGTPYTAMNKSGTSFSSPLVAGIAAVIWSLQNQTATGMGLQNNTGENYYKNLTEGSYNVLSTIARWATPNLLASVPPLSLTPNLVAGILPPEVVQST